MYHPHTYIHIHACILQTHLRRGWQDKTHCIHYIDMNAYSSILKTHQKRPNTGHVEGQADAQCIPASATAVQQAWRPRLPLYRIFDQYKQRFFGGGIHRYARADGRHTQGGHASINMCAHQYMYVCMHPCIHQGTHPSICVPINICMYACIHASIKARIHQYVWGLRLLGWPCLYVYTHVFMYV